MFYPKLALTNLKKNGKTYIPYLLTCILTVAMFYVIFAIEENAGLREMPRSGSVRIIMPWGVAVTGIFSAVFLFYTNSFLVKRRKKEFGLYQVLGMDKRNLTKMMVWETIFTTLISIGIGLILGLVFGKLMFLFLLKLFKYYMPLKFAIEPQALMRTAILFLAIFLVTLLFNVMQVRISNPIELMRGGSQGEKEPKSRWFLAGIGIITLGIGYFIALTTDSPLTAINKFFIAVILVIIGTYALFTAGSIAMLKILKKNKKFYYQADHFISVSGMIYRMKQNAAGLASTCILSTVVIVVLSTTVSLYIGMQDVLKTRYPTDVSIGISNPDSQRVEQTEKIISEEAKSAGIQVKNKLAYDVTTITIAIFDGKNKYTVSNVMNTDLQGVEQARSIMILSVDDYNQMEGKHENLQQGEVMVYTPSETFDSKTLVFEDKAYQNVKNIKKMKIEKQNMSHVIKNVYIIMPDQEAISQIVHMTGTDSAPAIVSRSISFDITGNANQREAYMQKITDRIQAEVADTGLDCRDLGKAEFYIMNGGFLFLGMYIGVLFLVATALIIYYKQISEGYDDRNRYQIMQKVGMDKKAVKRSIRSQVLTVFFLPLLMAVIHMAVAFKVITKLLAIMNMVNIPLIFICTVVTVAVFAVVYVIIYAVTSREYYKIIQ